MPHISVIIPIFNEEKNIGPLYEELVKVIKKINENYEIIFVEDGSADNSFSELEKIHKKDNKVKIIKFRKNFGQTSAMDAGIKLAKGEILITIDADLQNDPEDIPKMVNKLEEGYDLVNGWRKNRKDNFSKRIISNLANSFRKIITGEKIHDAGCTLKVFKKECFDGLDLYSEMHRFIPALLMWRGFKVTEIEVNHRPRKFGKSKYGIKRVIKGLLDLVTIKFWMQYSARPMHLFGGFGIMSTVVGTLIGFYLVYLRIFENVPISNRPLLLLAVLLVILGILFFLFGILADILFRIYYKGDVKYYKIERVL